MSKLGLHEQRFVRPVWLASVAAVDGWHGERSAPGCSASCRQALPGRYRLKAWGLRARL